MRLEVYGESVPEERVTRLALEKDGDSIYVIAVDAAGATIAGGHLMKFVWQEGRLYFLRPTHTPVCLTGTRDGMGCICELPFGNR